MDNVEIVQQIQNYIKEHSKDEDFGVESVCNAVGYSRRQVDRFFKENLGKTLYEYINAVCLTQGAKELVNTEQSVLEVALNSHFESHEGFTRSFTKRFHVTPIAYREMQMPIPLFVQHPISHYRILVNHQEDAKMKQEQNTFMVMVMPMERPARKLIYLQSVSAKGYLSFCEEMGCDWEGLLNSIPEKFDTASLIELPGCLQEEGYSKVAAGVEVPLEYEKPIPEQYKVAELPEITMLYFQTESYEKEEDFGIAIGKAYEALGKYDFKKFGYELAYDAAPSFNLGADPANGARIAVPVRRI